MTEIPCPLDEAAARHGDRPAVISGPRTISWRELRSLVATAAAALRQAGCGPGDRIGILAPNSPGHLVWLLAVLRLGGVGCPMNTRLPDRSVAELLRRLDCRTLLVTDVADSRHLDEVTVLSGSDLVRTRTSFRESARGSTIPLQRPATIVHTSGSAGVPKAVLHSCGNHYYNALGSNANLPLAAGDRWLLDLPLHHVAGLGIVFRCLLAGAAVVMSDREESLDVALDRYRVTHLSAVMTQLGRLVKRPGSGRFASLRCILVGGSEIPRKLLVRAQARGLPVFTSYGCTEMASQVTTTGADSTPAQRLTSGRLLPYRRLRIGDEGEILLRGETLFMGYVENGKVARPVDSGGWFATGDLGSVDEDGYLSVTGRRDNRFFSGGETIHPEEIERALVEHDDVEQAVVVPVPDEEYGERGVAFVRSRGPRPGAAGLEAWLRRTLPRYMVPDRFLEWPETERNSLKIDRSRFRRLARKARAIESPDLRVAWPGSCGMRDFERPRSGVADEKAES